MPSHSVASSFASRELELQTGRQVEKTWRAPCSGAVPHTTVHASAMGRSKEALS